jgi:hypothetical protein
MEFDFQRGTALETVSLKALLDTDATDFTDCRSAHRAWHGVTDKRLKKQLFSVFSVRSVYRNKGEVNFGNTLVGVVRNSPSHKGFVCSTNLKALKTDTNK